MKKGSGTIWIDLSDMLLWRGHFTGIQRVVYNLAKRFNQNDNKTRFFHYDQGRNCYLEIAFETLEDILKTPADPGPVSAEVGGLVERTVSNKIIGGMLGESKNLIGKVMRRLRRLISRGSGFSTGVLPLANFNNGDVVIVLGGNWDKPGYMDLMKQQKAARNFRFVQLYYDLIPIYDKGHVSRDEHERFGAYVDATLAIADGALAISAHTKKDLQRYMKANNIKSVPVTVIRLGDDIVSGGARVMPVAGLAPQSYILSVGTVEVRKNHVLLYYALKILVQKGVRLPKLVIAGKEGWLTDDIRYQFTYDPDVKDIVEFVPDASDQSLSWLYKNCRFTLYPSFYEGWGLPVAESLQYGKPCIASNSSSIPEVAGDLIDYHSPFDSHSLAMSIERYLSDHEYILAKERAIRERYQPHSWDQTYRATRSFLEKLL